MHRTPAVSTASTLFCVLSTVHNKLSATDRSGNAGAADPEYHQVGCETQKQWWDGHPARNSAVSRILWWSRTIVGDRERGIRSVVSSVLSAIT